MVVNLTNYLRQFNTTSREQKDFREIYQYFLVWKILIVSKK